MNYLQADGTVGGGYAQGPRQRGALWIGTRDGVLSDGACGCEHDGERENAGAFHICPQVRTFGVNRLLLLVF